MISNESLIEKLASLMSNAVHDSSWEEFSNKSPVTAEIERKRARAIAHFFQSEICVITLSNLIVDAIRYDDSSCADPVAKSKRVIQAIKPYLRTTDPVSVSLEKCMDAVNGVQFGNTREAVKAILDAAGVKYVD